MNVIEARGLTKRFGSVTAVAGIDLTIGRGEVVALLGPNGAGKTTALDMLLALTTPTSGELTVLGERPAQAIREGRISALLQTGGLLADMTVRETVTYIAAAYPSPPPVKKVLARTGLEKIAKRRVSKCSGGQLQRLKFALALLAEPDVLILDEPTTGMDVSARREFWAAMHAEATEGRTVIFATHYLNEAEEFADRIILMNNGKIVADGTMEEVRGIAGMRQLRARVTAGSHRHGSALAVSGQSPDSYLAPRSGQAPGASHAPGSGRARELIDGLTTAVPGTTADVRGDSLTATTPDSDSAARYLLAQPDVVDLTITDTSLEDTFIALTEDSSTGGSPTSNSPTGGSPAANAPTYSKGA